MRVRVFCHWRTIDIAFHVPKIELDSGNSKSPRLLFERRGHGRGACRSRPYAPWAWRGDPVRSRHVGVEMRSVMCGSASSASAQAHVRCTSMYGGRLGFMSRGPGDCIHVVC